MAKSLFLIIIAGLLWVIMNPVLLSATEEVAMTGLDPIRMVETVPLPEPEPELEPEYDLMPVISVPVMANYTVTRYVGSRGEYNSLANSLSYGDIYKFQKLIYGHNTWGLLGSLVNRYPGEIFTITEGGVAREYRVADVAVYQKTDNGTLAGVSMNSIAAGMGHDVALLTCYGTSYGNGDASHRIVVYADAV